MKNIELFIDTVEKMRTSQKEYFRTRSTIALNQSKALEKQVDKLLSEREVPGRTNQQTSLL